jgi:hypothetical protein
MGALAQFELLRRDVPRPHPDADDRRYAEPEPGPDYGLDQVPTQLGDLPHDALDVRLECGEVASFRIAAREYRGMIIWPAGGMPEHGCSTVSASWGPQRVRNGSRSDTCHASWTAPIGFVYRRVQ